MIRALFAIVAGASLAACGSLHEPHADALTMPSAWNDGSAVRAASTIAVDRAWWTSFGDARLASLVEESLRDSDDLAAAVARVDQARAQARVVGAARYPTLDARATLARSHGDGTDKQQLFLEAGYELDFWGRYRSAAQSADALATASALDRDTVELALAASVSNNYFLWLGLGEREALASAIVDNARRLLDLVQAQVTGGIASELELQQQRNVVATFEASLASLRQQRALVTHLLAVLVGREPEGFALPAPSAATPLARIPLPAVRAGLPSDLLRQRPDLRAAESRLQSARFDVASARAAFYPDFALTGALGRTSPTIGRLLSGSFFTDIALSAVQPIFEGGRLQGTLDLDRARERELLATYRKTVRGALQDVEDALSSIDGLADVEDAEQRAVAAARRAAELAEIRFRYGTVAFVTVLDSQRAQYQAEDALLQVRLSRLQASVGLFRALGGGFGDAAPVPVASLR